MMMTDEITAVVAHRAAQRQRAACEYRQARVLATRRRAQVQRHPMWRPRMLARRVIGRADQRVAVR